ncbi:hypothetical protein [Roseiflexus sp.]|uniref:hypothetical protein n=1 Tax=Roseiflexus sp. TaxID=2562120 RepID=UPI00398B3BEF
MDDAHGCDEMAVDQCNGAIVINGDYLLIEPNGQTRYIYQRNTDIAALHPLISRIAHNGITYALAWIEEEGV